MILTLPNGDLMWVALLGLLIGPFVQEDLAVVGAAGLSVLHPAQTPLILALIFIGLWASDIWKYWPGYLARGRGASIDSLKRPKLAALVAKMDRHLGKTLLTVRFIPFARIAAYIAAGYARVSYLKFCLWVALSALLYIAVIFCLFHGFGAALGERAQTYLPLIGLGIGVAILGVTWGRSRRAQF